MHGILFNLNHVSKYYDKEQFIFNIGINCD